MEQLQLFDLYERKSKEVKQKAFLECMCCDKRFRKHIGPRTFEIKCPNCGEYDVEIIG